MTSATALALEPLVPLVPVEDFTGSMKEMAERAMKRAGRIPNQQRAMANAGELGATLRLFLEDVFAKATLPAELRLLVRHKVSTMNRCVYCSAHQIFHLLKEHCSEEKIDHIHEYETYPGYTERERAAIAFAEAMMTDPTAIPEPVNARFVATFTPAERVEVALVASTMDLLNKLNDALRVPLEDSAIQYAGRGIAAR